MPLLDLPSRFRPLADRLEAGVGCRRSTGRSWLTRKNAAATPVKQGDAGQHLEDALPAQRVRQARRRLAGHDAAEQVADAVDEYRRQSRRRACRRSRARSRRPGKNTARSARTPPPRPAPAPRAIVPRSWSSPGPHSASPQSDDPAQDDRRPARPGRSGRRGCRPGSPRPRRRTGNSPLMPAAAPLLRPTPSTR